MPTVAVLADPPGPDALPAIAGTVLDGAAATRLYEAMLVDVCRTVQAGGADLLVNYRSVEGSDDPEGELREILSGELDSPGAARYEVQVGETFAGRVGNTVTHLLEEEGERQVAATTPAAPFLRRDHIGGLGMALRSNEVVLGPAWGGRVALAGFTEPVDFDGAYAPPAVETLAMRGRDAGLSVDFLPTTPLIRTPADLADAVAYIRARARAERVVPLATLETIDELGLRATPDDGELAVTRDADTS